MGDGRQDWYPVGNSTFVGGGVVRRDPAMPPQSIPIAYVAGPYRGDTSWAIECNIHAAKRVGVALAKLGIMPVIPHANTSHFDGVMSDKFWLVGTLELMRRCDLVVLVDGWERSSGAREEVKEARRLGIPVYDSIDDVIRDINATGRVARRCL